MTTTSLTKSLLKIFLGIVFMSMLFIAYHHDKAYRFYKVVTLFNAGNIVENFRSMGDIFPYYVIAKGPENFKFATNSQALIKEFEHQGNTYNVEKMLNESDTTGFLVIKNDHIVFEKYYLGNNEDTLNISWSVNKSYVSALLGIALEEKLFSSIQDPIDQYVPELKGTGYEGVSIKNIMQMSSGVVFDEDYAAFFSDINRMGRVIALGNSINEFASSLKSGRPAGEFHHYVSMDTQVLGMLLKQITGVTPSEYLHKKIWSKLGMRSDAKWLIDDKDMELAFGTLNVTVRDYARFGRLYLNNGSWEGEQIIPKQWIIDSTTPDAPHLQPGKNPASFNRSGYGYQWWTPEFPQDDYLARGIYGQYIYVSHKHNVVIVKTSADPDWRASDPENYTMVAMMQNIAAGLESSN